MAAARPGEEARAGLGGESGAHVASPRGAGQWPHRALWRSSDGAQRPRSGSQGGAGSAGRGAMLGWAEPLREGHQKIRLGDSPRRPRGPPRRQGALWPHKRAPEPARTGSVSAKATSGAEQGPGRQSWWVAGSEPAEPGGARGR
jgi:hypothetical protein